MDVDDAVVDAKMHPISLVFRDPEREERFKDFLYVKSGFYGGRVYQLLAVLFVPANWIFWYGIRQGWDTGMFTKPVWAPMIASFVGVIIMAILGFMERLAKYRELFYIGTLLSQHPITFILWTFGMGDGWYMTPMFMFYGTLLGMFLPQARFSRIAVILTALPTPTTVIGVAVTPSYWDSASHMEIIMWASYLIPPISFWSFERENRRSFFRVEKGEEAIAAIEAKAARTRSMIVNFFARTPTKDFLATGSQTLTRQRQYHNTAMVVTDLAGFTAWTSTIDAVSASEHLGLMFQSLDSHSERCGVEKISTVGDCFQGAIFPGSEVDHASAAMRMLEFGQAALGTFTLLQVRVGVHIGSVTAAFMGSSPPKFDLFGADWEITKTLESDGVAGRVHASRRIVEVAAPLGGPSGEIQETPTGVVFKFVRVTSSVPERKSADAVEGSSSDTTVSSTPSENGHADTSQSTTFKTEEIHSVCRALTRLGRTKRDPAATRIRRTSITSENSLSAGKYSPTAAAADGSRGDYEKAAISPPTGGILTPSSQSADVGFPAEGGSEFGQDATIDLDEAAKLTWKLVFKDPADELLYQDSVKRSGFITRAVAIAIVTEVVFFTFHMLVGCVTSTRNRLLVSLSVMIFGFYAVWELLGMNTRGRAGMTLAAFLVVPTLVAFSDTSCSKEARVYFQNNVLMLIMNAIFAFNFMIQVPLLWRLAVIYALGAWGLAFLLMRRFAFDDDYIVFDITPLVMPMFFCLISLSTDFMMRSAFTASRKVKIAKRRDKAGLQLLASTAVDVMVPAFVSERLTSGNAGTSKPSASHDVAVDDSDEENDENGLFDRATGVTQTWEFDRIVIMFVNVEVVASGSEGDDGSISTLNDTFTKLESILVAHGVQKIKTVGNTLMCAHGMGTERDPTFVQMQVAAQMAQRVLQNEPVTGYKVGVHVGPAFGAVMGTSSILFDVFGDSVNMASRMASTAAPNTVQVSEAVHARCSQHSVLRFSKNVDVAVKGKGRVSTYTLLV